MHENFPKHLRMGTARMKYEKDTEKEAMNKRVNMERSAVGTKKVFLSA